MKTTTLAAIAALVAVARVAAADPTISPELADGAGPRAAAEARALVATMQSDARVAREALELARSRRRRDEIRCADESLSRADVALRNAREDAAEIAPATAARQWPAALAALERVRRRASASHEARVLAMTCSTPQTAVLPGDRTMVTVRVDRRVARVDPSP
jgi:hypothetical protein